jgi:hypothetical protein
MVTNRPSETKKTKPIQTEFAYVVKSASAIPKAFAFEAATHGKLEKTKPI